MPETVRCSGCGNTFNRRGFGSHNAAMHGGEADAEPVDTTPADVEEPTETDPDPEPEPEPEGGNEPEPEDSGGGDLDLDEQVNQGREAYREAFEDESNEVEGDPDADQVSDDVEDTEDDARDYQCGNCGHPLEYLGGEDRDGGGKQCPECGERLYWSRVQT